MSALLKPIIARAIDGPLTRTDAQAAFDIIMDGNATASQIAGFLMVLRTRSEAPVEITAAARAMLARCKKVSAPAGAMDIVGTGGTGKATLNISTATAFAVAGAGVPVAKHGNKNISSLSGAADALGQMGINVMVEPEVVERGLAEAGIGFMMAPVHHPAMKHVMPARLELGTRTIFNILGPLTNPAGVKRQLTGVFTPHLLVHMAETLHELGSERAWLVHGSDGTDEITICGPTTVAKLENGVILQAEIHPEDAGLPIYPFAEITGGTPEYNGAALRAVLGGAKGGYRDAVLLNAAATLVIADKADTLKQGVEMAAESIDSGKAMQAAKKLAAVTSP